MSARYPAPYQSVTARADFVALYDLSKVPNTVQATPFNNAGPVECTSRNQNTCSWSCSGCLKSSEFLSCPNKQHWGLTFDDGPSFATTQLLKDLKAAQVNATFFVTGGQSLQFPEQLKNAHAAGHQICIHTWSHRAMTSMTNAVVVTDLEYTLRIVQEITGVRPNCIRPPFGDIDDRIRGILKAMNLKTYMWSHDTNDWKLNENPSAVDVVGDARAKARDWRTRTKGIISLQHDLTSTTASKASGLISAVRQEGMIAMSLRDCFGSTTTAPPIPPSLPISQDGQCGNAVQKRCPDSTCCSQYNWCGTTAEHCGTKCQPLFGKCS